MAGEKIYTVYRYYDSDDRLLYVGVTGEDLQRSHAHRRTALWWSLAVSAKFEHFGTYDQAYAHEQLLIRTLNPIYNVARPGRRAALRAGAVKTRWLRTYTCRYCQREYPQPRGIGKHRTVCKADRCQRRMQAEWRTRQRERRSNIKT